jgi:hypothetical protein
VGELVNEIMGRIVALNGAACGPILGQQRADNEAGTANANGGQNDEAGDHLAPSRPAIMPDHCGSSRPIRLASNRIECAEVVGEDARVGSSRRRYVELDPFAVSHRRTAPRMDLGRRLWRLFDAPPASLGGSNRRVFHAAGSVTKPLNWVSFPALWALPNRPVESVRRWVRVSRRNCRYTWRKFRIIKFAETVCASLGAALSSTFPSRSCRPQLADAKARSTDGMRSAEPSSSFRLPPNSVTPRSFRDFREAGRSRSVLWVCREPSSLG